MLDFKLRHSREIAQAGEPVRVLLLFKDDLEELKKLEFKVSSVAGDVAAGSVPVARLDELSKHPNVIFVEASRTLKDETDVSAVEINLVDPLTLRRIIPGGGRGAIIGIIDSGFDLTHPCFINQLTKRTRIIAAWDQTAEGDPHPFGFDYGVEHTREVIEAQAAANEILKNGGGHGTNVAGIAAGNGDPDGIFKGMAPEANLVLVTYKNDVPIGGSAFVLDAINYIRSVAIARDLPVIINLSQGDDLGPHDGHSLLERAIDNVVSEGRTLVVKSAGNGSNQPAKRHAQGRVTLGQDFILPFAFMCSEKKPVNGDTIELWYSGSDLFSVALKTPSGDVSEFVLPGESPVVELPQGTKVHVYSNLKHPTNGDNHIGIVFPTGSTPPTGVWALILRGEKISSGEFHAWADRPNASSCITFKEHNSDSQTITIPGNAHRIITVGGFVSRPSQSGETGEVKGTLAMGSSRGPTRDGRLKPDLTAPSSLISIPMSRTSGVDDHYLFSSGTSMAAPHVSGALALIWGLLPELTSQQIQQALYRNTRKDQFTSASANCRWGHGKLDIGAVYKFLQSQTEVETKAMRNTTTCEFEIGLKPTKGDKKTVRVQIDIQDGKALAVRGLDEHGQNVYDVSFRVHKSSGKKGGDECYECKKPNTPCPPFEMEEVPCPGGN